MRYSENSRASSGSTMSVYGRIHTARPSRDWKLTERGVGRFELYNLASDPGERTNLAATRPADLARMRAVYEGVRAELHTVPARE